MNILGVVPEEHPETGKQYRVRWLLKRFACKLFKNYILLGGAPKMVAKLEFLILQILLFLKLHLIIRNLHLLEFLTDIMPCENPIHFAFAHSLLELHSIDLTFISIKNCVDEPFFK